ncbi:hypothetical protein [Methylobacterium sp. Leaf89]|uniref:hypothetical protein n=1 Tax=Methylobacterium sp. Leaf89 TaxID=1736245 RepID=UPI000A5A4A32|nr:hypothetical protein [Methylobacterium sp. Leaf89]
MNDYWVDVRGIKVPLYLEDTASFGYEPKPDIQGFDAGNRKRYTHYKDKIIEANRGRLIDASLNDRNEIEAGYLVGPPKIAYYHSTAATPRVDGEA